MLIKADLLHAQPNSPMHDESCTEHDESCTMHT